jgi:hypothetical protein
VDFTRSLPAFDHCMMESLLALSSSEAARQVAGVWLEAFAAARAGGASEEEAHACATAAWRAAMSELEPHPEREGAAMR